MALLHSSATKPIILSIPVELLISFLLIIIILSQVSVVEGDCKLYNISDTFVIGVPGKPSFKSFVKREKSRYSGFCIEVFEAAMKELDCSGPFTYKEFDGTYNELVAKVANKTYSAAVGDITILAERWEIVAFTAPFTESGLTLVVPVRPGPKAGIFLKPFTRGMWLATAAVLVYTMFIVWFVERQSKNEEFCGPFSNQLGNALWFTFSSLFLAHRERIQSNYARIVVVVWLFLALILTQSYTANLTSMLTLSKLRPKIWSREKVGCDENAFMKKYIQGELNFSNEIIPIKDEDEYLARFKNGSISAAFLENPYAKTFVNRYCRNFTLIPTKYSFGGFGFIFQKQYSPLAADVSKAILQLSQLGELKRLEKKWLTPYNECSQSQTTTEDIDSLGLEHSETRTDDVDSLDLLSFRGLFLFSVATSSVCFLLFLGHLLKDYIYGSPQPVADVNENNEIVLTKDTAVTDCVVQY
ncbi:hypothetical protein RHGRI_037658 [Rhododendron griersonianum]|uniref:Ionotropic glutamate receptor C-terminal domain-containing protein n=1 Tax=Rhododendron griersonianum TaxID=479676 RepID=A0AAV6HXZ6_9ERIC|nr:hypothetical protein RHGRI_037658 [Rhododendron griersonianum]